MLAEQVAEFYPDLMDERFDSAFAIYHQRYSTNTFPQWWLAQPFRMLAHNGEINTLKGNLNWMKATKSAWRRSAFGDMAEDIKPIVRRIIDSAALDAVFEVSGARRAFSADGQDDAGAGKLVKASRGPARAWRTCIPIATR